MEETTVHTFMRPPFYGRLPFFKELPFALHRLTSLSEFAEAKVVKVERTVRETSLRNLVLDLGKSLAWTCFDQPNAVYATISEREIPFHYRTRDVARLRDAADAMATVVPLRNPVPLDLVVVPSLAVDPQSGERLGVGKGKHGMGSDLECAILTEIGAIRESTTIVTVVHPLQVMDLTSHQMEAFDVPVDFILTPWKSYATQPMRQRPKGVFWELLNDEHYQEAPVLNKLRPKSDKLKK